MSIVIKIENLSKQYRLGLISTRTLSHDLNRWWQMNILGRNNPYLKVGEINDRSIKGESEYVWALRDINLDIREGEVLGIIGNNGAGKSTLLKILSKITSPTKGSIKARGRIASLLEVGTGFHQEMTGRENIFMNGAIMGMTRAEISKKFDEIVDFAGIERYIDTPVKRYSSGMTVRLGFAVAAHLEPEILVVDEVLAVGDAEFQKKAIGKMQEVSSQKGRTILFVSHNMTAIENLCNYLCVLYSGELSYHGNIHEGIKLYLRKNQNNYPINKPEIEDDVFKLDSFEMVQDAEVDNFISKDPILVIINYRIKKQVTGLRIGFDLIDNSTGVIIFRSFHDENLDQISQSESGSYSSIAKIPAFLLKEGLYVISLSIGIHCVRWITVGSINKSFNLINLGGINKNYAHNSVGVIMPYIQWEKKAINLI